MSASHKRKKEFCSGSRESWPIGKNPFGYTPHQWRDDDTKVRHVMCTVCGRELKTLKHPGSPHVFFIVPAHYPG